jgi:hypothetical protein
VTISFNLAGGMALSDAVTAIQQMQQRIGMPGTVHGNFTGTAQAFQASLASEPFLILAALAAVYIVPWNSLRKLHSSRSQSYQPCHLPASERSWLCCYLALT